MGAFRATCSASGERLRHEARRGRDPRDEPDRERLGRADPPRREDEVLRARDADEPRQALPSRPRPG